MRREIYGGACDINCALGLDSLQFITLRIMMRPPGALLNSTATG